MKSSTGKITPIGRHSVTVIVPIFNEDESLHAMWDRLVSVSRARSDLEWSFLFVNDGSRDRSRELLDELATANENCQVIHLSRNFGHQMAVTAGLDNAHSDIVCIIDADLQDPPEVLLEMIKEIEGGYNMVYGQRQSRVGESWFKLMTASAFYRLLASMTKVNIPVDTGDFRAMDRKVVESVRSMREYHRFLRGMVAWVGFKTKPVLYSREARFAGTTKYPFRKMFKFALDALYSFSDVPLRVAGYLGLITFGLGFLGMLYIVGELLFFGNYITGVSAVLFAVLLIGGVQLLCLGVIGQYLGRVFDQLKGRPLYLVDDSKNLTLWSSTGSSSGASSEKREAHG